MAVTFFNQPLCFLWGGRPRPPCLLCPLNTFPSVIPSVAGWFACESFCELEEPAFPSFFYAETGQAGNGLILFGKNGNGNCKSRDTLRFKPAIPNEQGKIARCKKAEQRRQQHVPNSELPSMGPVRT